MIFTFKNSTDWFTIIKLASSDQEYFNAVKNKDKETINRMLKEKASFSGYTVGPVYHGTEKFNITEFFGGWWSTEKKVTEEFGSICYTALLKGDFATGEDLRKLYIEFNGSDIDPDSDYEFSDSELGDEAMSGGPFSRFVQESGKNGIQVWDESNRESGISYAIFRPNQVKLSGVTYDDSKVIPLSKRFDSNSDDIRY